MKIIEYIQEAKQNNEKLFAMLVDPDKVNNLTKLCNEIKISPPDLILVGGSVIEGDNFDEVVKELKEMAVAPVILFPGDATQISDFADAILLLSLTSGRNPDYLIGQHVIAAQHLKQWGKEIIPTSYLLLDGGKETSVSRVSRTEPLSQKEEKLIVSTALAGCQMGHQLVYLEAGSGATRRVQENIIESVAKNIDVPIIVGGGIKTKSHIKKAWDAGATIVVVGTAFETNVLSLKEIKTQKHP